MPFAGESWIANTHAYARFTAAQAFRMMEKTGTTPTITDKPRAMIVVALIATGIPKVPKELQRYYNPVHID